MSRWPKPNMRQLSAFVTGFVGLAVVVIALGVWRMAAANRSPAAEPQGVAVAATSTLPALTSTPTAAFSGTLAPDFSLTRIDTSEIVILSGLRGQPVILDFFASWCPSCRAEAPSLQEFWQAYTDRGLTLLGLAINDSDDGLRDFKEEFFLTYPIGLDKTSEIAAAYRVSSIPTFVFIDREGRIAKTVIGQMDENALVVEAEALLK